VAVPTWNTFQEMVMKLAIQIPQITPTTPATSQLQYRKPLALTVIVKICSLRYPITFKLIAH
jgi:hypothetical protein